MSWNHKIMTEEELKVLVKDVYDAKVFTSFQCDQHLMSMVFMPILFLNSPPSKPTKTNEIRTDRKNKLIYMDDIAKWKNETKVREDFF